MAAASGNSKLPARFSLGCPIYSLRRVGEYCTAILVSSSREIRVKAMAVDLDVNPASTTQQSVSLNRHRLGALVMDADYRGLAVVRSLRRHGIPVWVLQHEDQLPATISRYSRRTLSW